jgi:hypothetical protein
MNVRFAIARQVSQQFVPKRARGTQGLIQVEGSGLFCLSMNAFVAIPSSLPQTRCVFDDVGGKVSGKELRPSVPNSSVFRRSLNPDNPRAV